MKHQYHYKNQELELRPLGFAEIEDMRLLRNQNATRFVFSDEINCEAQKNWFERYLAQDGDYMFSAFYQDCWIGVVALYDVQGGTAEFGRLMIDRKRSGRGGLGCAVTAAACQLAVQQLGVHKILLEVYCDNPAAEITYLKAGFVPVKVIQDKNNKKMLAMEWYSLLEKFDTEQRKEEE